MEKRRSRTLWWLVIVSQMALSVAGAKEGQFAALEAKIEQATGAERSLACSNLYEFIQENIRAAEGTPLIPGESATDIFIHPPYEFRVVDGLLTNFHLPKSTLLMLVAAFAGRDFILDAYAEAIREGYRFYSYGDCMLIL